MHLQVRRPVSGHFNKFTALLVIAIGLAGLVGCVYYNTFYNARQAFNEAEKARKDRPGVRVNTTNYKKAIEKSMKVVENYSNSKYYDDALYVLMVSYYYTDAFSKCERRAREILANYPGSEYAKDAYLYAAKAKLEFGEIDDAMAIFQEIFEQKYDRQFKAEAASALGSYYFDQGEYEAAEPYLLALRDSLGSDDERRSAQRRIADAYFASYRFAEAQSAALQLLGMDPDKNDHYHALHMAAICSYRLQRIEEGHDYLRRLMEDEVYFDSMGVLDLLRAEGYEDDEDLYQAEIIYDKVITEQTSANLKAAAFYRLGLMYQLDYDDLTRAKEFYDSTSRLGRNSDVGRDALQRSSDIGKLEQYARNIKIDSSSSQELIDEAAYAQYQLAEVYWFKLDKPDSAMLEMRYVIDSFPTAYDAPKATIALSQMVRESQQDTAAADSMVRSVLTNYPHSDYVAEALQILGLSGTAADTGYAGLYFDRAEDFLADSADIDSARYYYQYVVDNYADSRYHLQSRFALIWLTETYNSPGDSSVFFAYTELVDSYPETPWATLARERTSYRPSKPRDEGGDEGDSALYVVDSLGDSLVDGEGRPDGEGSYVDWQQEAYIGPDGDTLELLPGGISPVRVQDPFVYPTEAYRTKWEGDLYFQILLDFSGEVVDYVLVRRSPSEYINTRAEDAIAGMEFDVSRIPERLQGKWLVYKFIVVLPDHLR
ncbi:MAG: tetratricopeptide repeat protein [bacterium]